MTSAWTLGCVTTAEEATWQQISIDVWVILWPDSCGCGPHHLSADGAVNSSQPGSIPPVGHDTRACEKTNRRRDVGEGWGGWGWEGQEGDEQKIRNHSASFNVNLLNFCLLDSHRRTGVHSWFPLEGRPAVNTLDTTCRCNTAAGPPSESFPPKPVRQTDQSVLMHLNVK